MFLNMASNSSFVAPRIFVTPWGPARWPNSFSHASARAASVGMARSPLRRMPNASWSVRVFPDASNMIDPASPAEATI